MTKRRFLALLGLGGGGILSSPLFVRPVRAADSPPGRARLLNGPMAGAVSPQSMHIWLRTSDSYEVSVEWSDSPGFSNPRRSRAVRPSRDSHFAATIPLAGLNPGTVYYYRVLLDDEPDPYTGDAPAHKFRTPELSGDIDSFSLGFGSCARYALDARQPIWNAVDRLSPDFFCWIGDNIYGDSGSVLTLADEYKRQRAVSSYQRIASRIPQLAIWDDHDYAFNDSDRRNPVKEQALNLFRAFWANPAYGLPDVPGVFFQYSYGGVDFFFLDVRYHRDPNDAPDGPEKTMLGQRQKSWLMRGLSSSTAPFKLIVSGSGWSFAKGFGGDSWASFTHERDEVFNFIRDREIGGVVLVSGDTHVAELNAIPWSERGGYDFYDLVSSPLAQPTSDSWLDRHPERRIRQPYFGTCNFGLISFEMKPEPVLTFNVIDTNGAAVWETFRLRAEELRNGESTWHRKMDELSRKRYERSSRGEPYFQ